MKKSKEIKQIRTEPENFNFWRGDWAHNIYKFPKTLNIWGTREAAPVILTWGESNLCWDLTKFQNLYTSFVWIMFCVFLFSGYMQLVKENKKLNKIKNDNC